jgi:hypothetical protein
MFIQELALRKFAVTQSIDECVLQLLSVKLRVN